jgi:hypothetical protein
MEESEEQGVEQHGAEQMDIEGNQQMDMDNNDNDGQHETETDGVEMTDGHETGDSIASGSRRRSRWKSHVVMPPLVLDSEDGKIVIKPTGDG